MTDSVSIEKTLPTRTNYGNRLKEVCCDARGGCRLYFNYDWGDYQPMNNCQRGKLCTEFRIFKDQNVKGSSIIKDFTVFKDM